ncbi:MAG TPA: sugar phosphate isomerase/epimerase family protein [Candidatus Acidoferrales bacterium]|jgi:L-ribulose-5-phosphate 3-epimerase|nr:sugar phosphate isomerase/epimerase family protein [Candidatus Acidoferrales bacterium]
MLNQPAHFRIAAITDEFSPDLETALGSMAEIGMTGAELRMVFGKNVIDLTDDELDRAIGLVRARGMEIISIASPLLKCVLPDAPDVDVRFQQDMFASRHTFADQPRLTARAFEIARRTGARIIRVFSYWRTIRPEECFARVVDALASLAGQAAAHSLVIGLENEHACHIATGAETGRLLAAVDHPNLKIVWDPANAMVSGETPFPDGYSKVPPGRIVHVHAKDCKIGEDHKSAWVPLGTGDIDWTGQIASLARDGYGGWISLETHWAGPGGDKHEASRICGRNLMTLAG